MLAHQQLRIALSDALNDFLVQQVLRPSLFLGVEVFLGEEETLNQIAEFITLHILWVLL